MKNGFRIPLTAVELMAMARQQTGIDLYDEDVVEPLTILVGSLNDEACLHEQGALAMQNRLLRLLRNRLRMRRDFERHPEIREENILPPIIVTGMARSGTTKIQKLLAASGDFNWMPFWQVINPALFSGNRDESPQARINETGELIDWCYAASPESRHAHTFSTNEPEETCLLEEHSLRNGNFIGYANVPSFVQWLAAQGPRRSFEFLRETMQYLQWQGFASSSKRWLLKNPMFCGSEALLLDVFPDSQIIMMHRHPRKTSSSTCQLVKVYTKPYSDLPFATQILIPAFAYAMSQHLTFRSSRPDKRPLDIAYKDIIKSAEEAIQNIYDFIGMSLSETARANMSRWEANNPIHKSGVFKHSLEEFGLGNSQIDEAFATYIKDFSTLLDE